ncbi:MAG TPA: glycosyltransferase [Candidatus Obscuribacterales bacterium]
MSFHNIFLVNAILDAFLCGLTMLFFRYFRKVDPVSLPDDQLPFISVVVPARNEGTKVGRCLESLAKQDYPNYEIIAINDRSVDDTGAVIKSIAERYPNVRSVYGQEAPPGWIGKCNALVHGVKYAGGQWLLFTDADTVHTPDSLRLAVSYALKHNAELISFMPVQELGSFWEKVVMPVLLGSFLCGDPMNTINDRTNDRAYAYGQYILVRRDVYEAVGGHHSVFDQILDDISFARVVKEHGYHIMAADGRLLYRVRMYTNLETLWQGWTKNLFALIECQVVYLFLVITLINIAVIGPFVSAAMLVFMAFNGEITAQFYTILAVTLLEFGLLFPWYKRCAEHYTGVGAPHFLLLPLGSLTVSLLYLHSAYLVLSKTKVSWKGRQYMVNTHKSVEAESDVLDVEKQLVAAPTEPGS